MLVEITTANEFFLQFWDPKCVAWTAGHLHNQTYKVKRQGHKKRNTGHRRTNGSRIKRYRVGGQFLALFIYPSHSVM